MIFKKTKKRQEELEQEEKIEIVFNQEEFKRIREKSEEIQKKLIIEEDIENRRGYILFDNGENIGYLCLDFSGDASYDEIEGKWLSEQPYAVIHRLAISDKARGKGKGVEAFSLAWNVCVQKKVFSLRVDTHEENMKMQHIIKKSGFIYCGIVYQLEGKRLAYEKLT